MTKGAALTVHSLAALCVAFGTDGAAVYVANGVHLHVGAPLMGMPPSGRRAEWTEIGVLEIENGKIVKSWYEVDMLSMIQQLTGQK